MLVGSGHKALPLQRFPTTGAYSENSEEILRLPDQETASGTGSNDDSEFAATQQSPELGNFAPVGTSSKKKLRNLPITREQLSRHKRFHEDTANPFPVFQIAVESLDAATDRTLDKLCTLWHNAHNDSDNNEQTASEWVIYQ